MTARTPFLAAVAAAAVPGLRPTRVEEVVDRIGDRFRVAFVEDDEQRRWVVRLPGDAVAAALQDESADLMHLLASRLPFAVPEPEGVVALRDGRRAVVYPLLEGRPVSFASIPPGPGPAALLGRAVAAVHDLDRRLFEEADVPDYDAADLRTRRQIDVDRGAATGLVPTGLLARWERMLDDVAWWRFAPTPVHGRLDDAHVLFTFDDPQDVSRARLGAVTSWEGAHVGDPAEDLAELLRKASPEAFDTIWDAYSGARVEPADGHLLDRAGLLGELRLLSDLLAARNAGDRAHVTAAIAALRRLDDAVSAPGTSGNRSGTVADRLPVDFAPVPAGGDFYRSGSPAALDAVHEEPADAPRTSPDGDATDDVHEADVHEADVHETDTASSTRVDTAAPAAGDNGYGPVTDAADGPEWDDSDDAAPRRDAGVEGTDDFGRTSGAGLPRPVVTFEDDGYDEEFAADARGRVRPAARDDRGAAGHRFEAVVDGEPDDGADAPDRGAGARPAGPTRPHDTVVIDPGRTRAVPLGDRRSDDRDADRPRRRRHR